MSAPLPHESPDDAGPPVDLLFDVRHIRQSGIGTYIRTQLRYLEQVMSERGMTLAILADRDTAPAVSPTTRVIHSDPAGARMYSAGEQRAWDHALTVARPRALWVPHYPFPVALLRRRHRGVQFFSTVHDTLHIEDESLSNQGTARRTYARVMLRLTAKRAATIFTPSEATARALTDFTASANVSVTPIPVDDAWLAPVDPALSPFAPRYFLYVGNIKRHKNLLVLLDAFTKVLDSVPHTLVIAGSGDTLRTLDERVNQLVDELGDRVEVPGRLPFDQLRAMVARADLLVMPSLYEGAGLPPVEAMASHTAVLSSNIAVLQETCGDGADYFDPYDAGALAELLRKFSDDDSARGELRDRGWSHVTRRQAAIDPTKTATAICAALDGTSP
ncbi:glycosyltransferase family 4 protein [Williamsia soli]|uniref:glycosyltransferase family 4 protein n=1 Tax=Williamsia soli TaxID=364929 RepID=UPI0027DD48AA|nr:glycosyltransferase family 1 protein [Williamsia soli]